jgi:hypothetical protein
MGVLLVVDSVVGGLNPGTPFLPGAVASRVVVSLLSMVAFFLKIQWLVD